jgi:5-methylcytosine-specific restriction protein A
MANLARSGKEKNCMNPMAPMRPCGYPGCATLTDTARCERHRIQERRELEARRGSAASRGYGRRWRAARKLFLDRNPLCAECQQMGRLTAATIVDHVIPHKGDTRLFWDMDNWEAICKSHHDQKTASQDGGFGNKRAVTK